MEQMTHEELVRAGARAHVLTVSKSVNYFYWHREGTYLVLGEDEAVEEFCEAVESFPQGLPMQHI